MPTAPKFDPNATYAVPAFDPSGTFQAQPAAPSAPTQPEGFWAQMQNYAEHPEQRGAGQPNAMNRFAGGIVQTVGQAAQHPLDTIGNAVKSAVLSTSPAVGVFDPKAASDNNAVVQTVRDVKQNGAAAAAGHLVGSTGVGAAMGLGVEGAAAVLPKALPFAGRVALLGKTPEGAYESALKPSTTLSQADRAAVVKTGLENEIPVSKAGVEKIGDRIDALNDAIKDEIASDPTRPIDPNKVATRSADARAKFAKQVNAQPDLNAIEASKQQFLTEQGQKPGVPAQSTGLVDAQGNPIMRPAQPPTPAPDMNASDAQAMKQGTYRVLKGKFGEQGSASVEAQKALARGLKEEIATQFPEISKLNATESQLLDLQPLLERAVGRISNHQVIGIGTPVAGAAAKAVTGSGGAAAVAATLKAVLDNPAVKSRLAIAVSKASKIPYPQALSRVQAYSVNLGATAGASQASSTADSPDQPTTPQP